MFSFFKKSNSIPYADKVWKTRSAMLKGLTTEALTAISQREFVVILFWFEEQRKSFVAYCQAQKVPVSGLEDHASQVSPVIWVTDAQAVINSLSISVKLTDQAKKSKVVLLFDGHYPLIQQESMLLEKIKGWNPENFRLTFCQSLDSPFFKQFGGDKLLQLLEQLGIKEDECLEHAMIAKSIARAREKLAESITTEMSAHSEGEWFSKNKQLS